MHASLKLALIERERYISRTAEEYPRSLLSPRTNDISTKKKCKTLKNSHSLFVSFLFRSFNYTQRACKQRTNKSVSVFYSLRFLIVISISPILLTHLSFFYFFSFRWLLSLFLLLPS